MTLDELIKSTELSIRLDKQAVNGIRDDIKAEGRSLTDEEKQTIRALERKVETGKENLDRLLTAKAEEDATDSRMDKTKPTNAATALMGVGARDESAEYVYRDSVYAGRNAAVKRG